MQTTTSAPAPYRLRLLGKPALLDPQGRPTGTVAGKSIAILCYLVLRGGANRDELLALLWGDMAESRARNACRQALHRLRQSAPGLLESEGDRLRITPGNVLADVTAFQAAVDAEELEQAAHIYTGDLFDSPDVSEPPFLHWCDAERLRLRNAYHAVLMQLAEEAMIARRTEAALRWARAYRASAPAEAAGALLESKILAAAGRREEAAQALAAYSDQLKREYDLPEPSRVTEARTRLDAPGPIDRPAVDAGGDAENFVGRERELSALLTQWGAAQAGDGSIVTLIGRAGMGKTRLANEFVTRCAHATHAVFAWGTEPAHDGRLPYAAMAQALRGMLRAPGIGGASEHLLAEASRLLPELRDRFRLPVAPPISDETARLRLFEGIAALIDAVAYEQPVCIVLDHAERSTAESGDLLRYLQVRLAGSAVLFIVIADVDRDEWTRRAGDTAAMNIVELSPLHANELAVLGSPLGLESLPLEVQQRLIGLAEGSPGKLVELLRCQAEGRPLVSPLVEVSAIFSSRLAALSGTEKRLFAAAALLGAGVPLRILAAAAHIPEPAALSASATLKQVGLLTDCGTGYEVPCASPAHVATQVLGEASVVLIAGWCAEAIEYQRFGSHSQLAWLYKYAGRPADAFRTLRQAADDALAIGATEEAQEILEQAVAVAADRQQRAGVELLLRALKRQSIRGLPGASLAPVPRMPRNLRIAAVLGGFIVLAAAFVAMQRPQLRAHNIVLRDTLLLNSAGDDRFADIAVTGALAAHDLAPEAQLPRLPWVNALGDPHHRFVALERITPAGTDVYLINGRDTIPLVAGGRDDFVLGWSPDGQWVLVARGKVGGADFDTDLVAYSSRDRGRSFVIDEAPERRVVEAAWSPTGSHIAWVVETAVGRAILLSGADGAQPRNISLANTNDYHISWSPDGARLGFTTTRFGNPEIAAFVLATNKVWRLTYNQDVDDHVRFSPDGRYAAFESAADGQRSVSVVRSWGGRPVRIANTDAQTAIVGWSRPALNYVANVRMVEIESDGNGKLLEAILTDLNGDALTGALPVSFSLVEDNAARIERTENPRVVRVMAPAGHVVQLIANIGGWRSDTTHVVFGTEDGIAFADDFASGFGGKWILLGRPLPRAAGGFALLQAGHQMESGLLGRQTLPIRHGMTVNATIRELSAMRRGRGVFALVAPDPPSVYDEKAPQFLKLASVQFLAGGTRIAYSVQREIQTEQSSELAQSAEELKMTIRVLADRTVEFSINGKPRWRSSARLQDDYGGAQIWLAAGDGGTVTFNNVNVVYER